MELSSCNILVLLAFSFELCLAQQRGPSTTTADCVVNTCSYSRDTHNMDCESRQLVCVPSNKVYKQSESIKLAQNTITRIKPTSFSGYSRLTQLDISNNLITILDTNAFRTISTLRKLFINFNQLTEIGPTSFSYLRNLIILQIQGNHISNIHQGAFRDLVSIRELNLAGNRLNDLPDGVFSAMSAMQMLFLQENQLIVSTNSHILRGLRGLQDIDLDGNRFSAIPRLDDLSRLTGLDMTDSHVTIISNNTFRNTVRLRDVVLSGNIISTIEPFAFSGLRNAVELDLSNNAITDIPLAALSPLRSLEILLLQNNLMIMLTSEHFVSLGSLMTLNVEGNRLKMLPLMTSLHSLSVLNAKANFLETFDQPMLRALPRLSKLQLAGNTMQCDCRLQALTQWYIASGPTHHPHEIPQCKAVRPRALRGRRITTLSQGDLVCEAPAVHSGLRQVHRVSGASLTLSCIYNGFPSPLITWMVPGGLVYSFGTSGRIMVTENGDLVFEVVEAKDQGQYTCFGSNPVGTASVSITLYVTPMLQPPPQNPHTVPPNHRGVQTTLPLPGGRTTNLTMSVVVHSTTVNPSLNGRTETVFPPHVVTETMHTVSNAMNDVKEGDGRHSNHSNTDKGDKDTATSSPERDIFLDSNVSPRFTQPNVERNDEDNITPVCLIGHSGGGLLGAILGTFVFTILACVFAIFIAWKKGLVPSGMKVNDQKERLVNMTSRRESSTRDPPVTPTQPYIISYRQRRQTHPRTVRSGRQSYGRMEDSSVDSSYSSGEMSTESVSVSSRDETARYVITESVIDPASVRMRQQRLAAVANSLEHSRLVSVESDISRSGYTPRHEPSQRRVYANAAMVEQDPNYTSLWRQRDSNQPTNDESARNVESRIYVDVR